MKRNLRDVSLVMNAKITALKSMEMLYSCPFEGLVVQLILKIVNTQTTFFLFKSESNSVACSKRTLVLYKSLNAHS